MLEKPKVAEKLPSNGGTGLVWGLAPRKNFEILSSETSRNILFHAKMLFFIIRIHAEKEKLVLSNFEDLELKKQMLQQILHSTVVCKYAGASRKPIGFGCKAQLNLPEFKWLISCSIVANHYLSNLLWLLTSGRGRRVSMAI